MRSDYIDPVTLDHIMAALTPQNERAMRVALATGLRIDDVLTLKTADIMRTTNNRITVNEQKTKKHRRVYIPELLLKDLRLHSGVYYVFEGRTSPTKHRTRQAVWKDIKRAAEAYRVRKAITVSPHTARKVYAVEAFKKYGTPEKVQRLLQHSDPAVTALYILAEEVTKKKLPKEKSAQKTH